MGRGAKSLRPVATEPLAKCRARSMWARCERWRWMSDARPTAPASAASHHAPRRNLTWALLMARAFEVDVLSCAPLRRAAATDHDHRRSPSDPSSFPLARPVHRDARSAPPASSAAEGSLPRLCTKSADTSRRSPHSCVSYPRSTRRHGRSQPRTPRLIGPSWSVYTGKKGRAVSDRLWREQRSLGEGAGVCAMRGP
jgi:hypothetical protein